MISRSELKQMVSNYLNKGGTITQCKPVYLVPSAQYRKAIMLPRARAIELTKHKPYDWFVL
jgi:hypothetical protein